ncbi:MAG TPA: carboxypeptidase-like regulatory domain-containing protein [Silvibacterium sp.]|nr:carboxypeptidase-like regulatory domain-containing protein [Silvibacterium sp.]
MRKTAFRCGLLALVGVLFATVALAQSTANKTLEGKVFGSGNAPLSGAIVYLEDSKTNEIRSFISTNDGSYRFGELASDTDYHVWARYKEIKSATKPVSSYDSRHRVEIDLHIKTK